MGQNLLALVVVVFVGGLGLYLVATRDRQDDGDKVVLVFEAGVGVEFGRWLRDMVEAYNAAQDRVVIRPRIVPPLRYPDKLLAESATGTMGDIVEMHVTALPRVAAAGALIDLATLIADRGLDTSDFFSSALEGARYGGRQFALPLCNSAMCLFYNRDLFDAAGVSYPTDDWTWDDWEAAWGKLTRVGGRPARPGERPEVYGTLINPNPSHMLPLIWSNGGDLLNAEMTAAVVDQPEAVAAARFYLERMARYAPDASSAKEMTSQGAAFVRGKVATLLEGPWAVPAYRQADFRWDAALLPRPPGKSSISRFTGLNVAIAGTCRHPREAFDFIAFLTGMEAQTELVRRKLDYSPRRSIGYSEITLDPATPWDEGVFVRAVEHSRLPPLHADLERIYAEAAVAMEKVILHKVDVGAAMSDLARRLDQLIARRQAKEQARAEGGVPLFSLMGLLFGALVGSAALLVLLNVARGGAAMRRWLARSWGAYLFIAPNWLGFLAFSLVPICAGLIISFTEWDIIGAPRWVGLDNYRALFALDQPHAGLAEWWRSFANGFGYSIYNTLFMMMVVPITMCGSLLLAVLLNRRLKMHRFYRLSFFLPSITVGVGIYFLWELLLQKDGVVNTLIALTGLVEGLNALFGWELELVNWFHGSTWTSKPAVMMVTFWGTVGGRNMILYLAGLAGINPQLYEAAEIDGAGALRKFWYITIPMLAPTSFFIFVVSLISAMDGGTDIGLLITKGGPDRSTTGMGLDLYFHGWSYAEMGKAAAIGYVMFAMIFVMTLLAWRWGKEHGGTDVV